MSLDDTKTQLEILIRARYPLIYCTSFEELRVERMIQSISEKRASEFLIWTRTKGFIDSKGKVIEKANAPDRALQFIDERKGTVTFLLKDFHPYLKDPGLVRKLRDLARSLKLTKKNIVFVSPSPTIPPELSKELAILDIPLPNRMEIGEIFDRIPGAKNSNRVDCVEGALGLCEEEIENVFAKSFVENGKIDVEDILKEKRQIVQKAGILDFVQNQSNFETIGGLENLKDWLVRRKLGFSAEARSINLPTPKGILLVGLPGCGKSLTATCLSDAWKMPLLRLDMGKIFSGLVGSSEENMRLAIKTAESVAPCILWMDEIEKGLSGTSGSSDGGTSSRVFGTFLTWMQEKKKPVFVFATANDVSGLPPELLRKGRFDEIFFLDSPNEKERYEILMIHLKKRDWEIKDFDKNRYLRLSEQFTGAELEQALIDAKYESFFQKKELSMDFLSRSLTNTVPLSRTMKEKIEAIRSWAKQRAVPASHVESGKSEKEQVRALEV